jgi:hypothetical protein
LVFFLPVHFAGGPLFVVVFMYNPFTGQEDGGLNSRSTRNKKPAPGDNLASMDEMKDSDGDREYGYSMGW